MAEAMSDTETLAVPSAMIAAGQASLLADQCRARIAEAPADFAARYRLAAALSASGQAAEAKAELDQARLLHGLLVMKQWGADLGQLQTDAAYAAALGQKLYGAGHVALASLAYGAAIEAGARDSRVAGSRAPASIAAP